MRDFKDEKRARASNFHEPLEYPSTGDPHHLDWNLTHKGRRLCDSFDQQLASEPDEATKRFLDQKLTDFLK